MIRLGHIEYSNCFPVHARLLEPDTSSDIEIVRGTPSQLNRALEASVIDVAPASSIEYARHADAYRLLPDFVIASDGPVASILFDSKRPMERLENGRIALPTASATSVVLLKILLQLKYDIAASFFWFDQDSGEDPLLADADAALWIGDVALRRVAPEHHHVYDLGAEWKQWTGLPFVFAAWQTSAPTSRDDELRGLLTRLHESHSWFNDNAGRLAERQAPAFGVSAAKLLSYWRSLCYRFDQPMQQGLTEYYRLAAQLGEAPAVPRLRWLER